MTELGSPQRAEPRDCPFCGEDGCSRCLPRREPGSPQRGTCPTCGHYPWRVGAFPAYSDSCGFHGCGCKHSIHFDEPVPQSDPAPREYQIGQVVWNEAYQRYMKILSIVWSHDKAHSYIVADWNTKGTIQIHPDKMRPLTADEAGLSTQGELISPIQALESIAALPCSAKYCTSCASCIAQEYLAHHEIERAHGTSEDELLNEMVRDFTTVGPRPKSEVRRRMLEWRASSLPKESK